jgi:hypothetical protein
MFNLYDVLTVRLAGSEEIEEGVTIIAAESAAEAIRFSIEDLVALGIETGYSPSDYEIDYRGDDSLSFAVATFRGYKIAFYA